MCVCACVRVCVYVHHAEKLSTALSVYNISCHADNSLIIMLAELLSKSNPLLMYYRVLVNVHTYVVVTVTYIHVLRKQVDILPPIRYVTTYC